VIHESAKKNAHEITQRLKVLETVVTWKIKSTMN